MHHLYTNGIATYFEDAALGGASGPAVVLIHGHSADLRMWDEQVRSEARRAAFERLWLADPLFDGLRRFPDRFERLREMVSGFPAVDYREGAGDEGYAANVIGRLAADMPPALVIVGENDIPDFHLVADVLAESLAKARKLVLPDCGHLPPMERPEAFKGALVAFLQGLSGPQPRQATARRVA